SPDDVLTPYKTHHGPLHRRHRETRSCQSVKYRNVTHTKHGAQSGATTLLPLVETHHIVKEMGSYSWDKKPVYINHQVVNSPLTTWSVLEPVHPGTCQNGSAERATVEESSRQKQCLVATNGGFFNTHTGECQGNIVSDGFLVRDSGGIQNAHFGLTKDGFIYTGYLSELDLVLQDFTQLVGGVVWLVRDGENYVDESKAIECSDTEETGAMDRFVTVMSARSAVGHDAKGRIHMVQVNGRTDVSGHVYVRMSMWPSLQTCVCSDVYVAFTADMYMCMFGCLCGLHCRHVYVRMSMFPSLQTCVEMYPSSPHTCVPTYAQHFYPCEAHAHYTYTPPYSSFSSPNPSLLLLHSYKCNK
ncbi:unnamed protein product, partial [Candidula unifasciata]